MNLISSVASGRWRRAGRPAALTFGIATVMVLVSACGQKGALTMPAPAKPSENSPSPAPAPASAPAVSK